MLCYKYGSYASAHVNYCLTVPSASWIGLTSDDIDQYRLPLTGNTSTLISLSRFGIEEATLLNMTVADRRKIEVIGWNDVFMVFQPHLAIM